MTALTLHPAAARPSLGWMEALSVASGLLIARLDGTSAGSSAIPARLLRDVLADEIAAPATADPRDCLRDAFGRRVP